MLVNASLNGDSDFLILLMSFLFFLITVKITYETFEMVLLLFEILF